jgi:tetratricopeptide (TPR) repeat protein
MLRRRERLASFGLFWFLLLLVPSSALVVLDQAEPMAEHRVYLASCGMFLAAGTAIGWIGWSVGHVSSRILWLATGALAMVLLSFAAETVARNAVWGTPVTLWQESVDLAPGHFRPRLLLGEALEDAGRRGEAIVQFQAAVRLRPTEPSGYSKLGRCLADMGRLDEAAASFRNLQALDAGSVVASSGLAVVAMLSGQPERARQHFLATIAIDPQNVPARRSLAELDETALANPAEALRLCQEIERLAPGTPETKTASVATDRGWPGRSDVSPALHLLLGSTCSVQNSVPLPAERALHRVSRDPEVVL